MPPQTTLHRPLITPPLTISQQQNWLIAIGLIAVDLLFPVIPIIQHSVQVGSGFA